MAEPHQRGMPEFLEAGKRRLAGTRPAPSLFAFDLQLAITSILLQPCFAPHAPLKSADTAFAVTDLGRRDDLNSDLLNGAIEPAPFPVLPRPPLLVTVVRS